MTDNADNESLSNQIRSAFLDWKMWFYMFIHMGGTTSIYGLNSFLPTIVGDSCSTNSTTELLTVPPYIGSCLTMLISCWSAGRLNERSNHMMILLLIEISGFLYLILADKYMYIGVMIVGTGVFSLTVVTLSWMTNNIDDSEKRAVSIALVISSGNIGSILGQQIYLESDNDSLIQGHWIIVGILCFTFILVLLFKVLLKYENRRRRNLTTVEYQNETVVDESRTLLNKVNFVSMTDFLQ